MQYSVIQLTGINDEIHIKPNTLLVSLIIHDKANRYDTAKVDLTLMELDELIDALHSMKYQCFPELLGIDETEDDSNEGA